MQEYFIVNYMYIPICGPNEDFGGDTLFSIVPRRGGETIGRRDVFEMMSRDII